MVIEGQIVGHIIIWPVGSLGSMPGTLVRLLRQHGRHGGMGQSLPGGRLAQQDACPDQGMAKSDGRLVEPQDPRMLGRFQYSGRDGLAGQHCGPGHDVGQFLLPTHCGDEKGIPGQRWKLGDVGGEGVFQAVGERRRRAVAQFIAGWPDPGKFDQGERVSGRRVQNRVRIVEIRRGRDRKQLSGRVLVQAV